MYGIGRLVSFLCLVLLPINANAAASTEVQLDGDKSKLSYALGLQMADQIIAYGLDLDRQWLISGINDQLDDHKPKLSKKEALKVKQIAKEKLDAKIAAKNKVDGEAFLVVNSRKKGVVVTKTGLQYEIIKQGHGTKPKLTDKITCHYLGTLIDGKAFNQYHSYDDESTFSVDQVIKGWAEGLQMMRVGSIYRFVVPSQLAFGDRARGSTIGPNSVLIFKVELLSINHIGRDDG